MIKSWVEFTGKICNSRSFLNAITGVILINGVVIGLETSDQLEQTYGDWFALVHQITIAIFLVEAVLKLSSHYPQSWNYFKDPWNSFDFVVLVVCLIPGSGFLPILARVLRLLRVLSVLPALRILVVVLMRSLPGMFNIVLLMLVIFYVYGVAGHHLFGEVDPTHWRSLGISLLSLFRIVTLEDWTDIMYVAMEHYWWAWAFFISLILFGTFVVVNLVIAVIIQNHQEAVEAQHRSEQEEQHDADVVWQREMLEEVKRLAAKVDDLERRLSEGQLAPKTSA